MDNLNNHVAAGAQLAVAMTALTQLAASVEHMYDEQATAPATRLIDDAIKLVERTKAELLKVLASDHPDADSNAINGIYPAQPPFVKAIFPDRAQQSIWYYFSSDYRRAAATCFLLFDADPTNPNWFWPVATALSPAECDHYLDTGIAPDRSEINRNQALMTNLTDLIRSIQDKYQQSQ